MRFEDALMNLLVDNLHPDVILSHDDWGSKWKIRRDKLLKRYMNF